MDNLHTALALPAACDALQNQLPTWHKQYTHIEPPGGGETKPLLTAAAYGVVIASLRLATAQEVIQALEITDHPTDHRSKMKMPCSQLAKLGLFNLRQNNEFIELPDEHEMHAIRRVGYYGEEDSVFSLIDQSRIDISELDRFMKISCDAQRTYGEILDDHEFQRLTLSVANMLAYVQSRYWQDDQNENRYPNTVELTNLYYRYYKEVLSHCNQIAHFSVEDNCFID